MSSTGAFSLDQVSPQPIALRLFTDELLGNSLWSWQDWRARKLLLPCINARHTPASWYAVGLETREEMG